MHQRKKHHQHHPHHHHRPITTSLSSPSIVDLATPPAPSAFERACMSNNSGTSMTDVCQAHALSSRCPLYDMRCSIVGCNVGCRRD
eukprot:1141578-Pyramimonas_sp.AAC.1